MVTSTRALPLSKFDDRVTINWIHWRSVFVAFIMIVMIDWYTIKAVDQDSLEDIPMPPAPPLANSPTIRHRNISESVQEDKK